MQPDNKYQIQPTGGRGSVTPPQRGHEPAQAAVANLTRDQIDSIYSKQAQAEAVRTAKQPTTLSHTSPAVVRPTNSIESAPQQAESIYNRTHTDQHAITENQWQMYHSSWQDYYQKYYEHYYVGAVKDAHSKLQQHAQQLQAQASQTPAATSISKDEAIDDLRSQIRGKIEDSAKKVRRSRHFVPIISSIAVLLVFVFLQYNSVIVAYAEAYVSPGNVNPDNIIVDPNVSTSVDPAPRLIIPKINVDISVDYNTQPDYNSQMAAMKSNVAYFGIPGANAKPGQFGNVPIAGHSSNDFTDSGEAKFIFARLEQLEKGDTFYLNYNGTRYTYTIVDSKIVAPTDVSSLQIGSDNPMATLITCVPLGTANNRLLVFGKQISPAPSTATANDTPDTGADPAKMAGKSPTLLERAFGAH